MTRIYSTLSDGVDEILGQIPDLPFSVVGHNLLSSAALTMQSSTSSMTTSQGQAQTLPASISEDLLGAAEAEAELEAFADPPPTDAHPSTTANGHPDGPAEKEPFVKPICDLFLELFFLNRQSSWLRGRAAVVILHQLLGSTIQRRVQSLATSLLSPPSVLKVIEGLKSSLQNRKEAEGKPPRSAAEKARTRREANLMLEMLLPDLAAGVVGRGNAELAARRVKGIGGNARLMEEVCWRVVDTVFENVFGRTSTASQGAS